MISENRKTDSQSENNAGTISLRAQIDGRNGTFVTGTIINPTGDEIGSIASVPLTNVRAFETIRGEDISAREQVAMVAEGLTSLFFDKH